MTRRLQALLVPFLLASLVLSLALVPVGCGSTEDEASINSFVEAANIAGVRPRGTARDWEHETSDVAPDPRIHFGEFDNGLRWAWASNPEPDQRSYLRLHVDTGSFGEENDEHGLAHFLEHMAFNGSDNFEAGTLVEWFQEHGMSFGADLNAHTAFSETVYKLDFPESDEESLREGLLVLRDFAFGMTLADEEVENEKGVIDGEQRERDSAGFRVFEQTLENLYSGTRYAERMPIGTKAIRDRFTGQGVRDFYARWYRPENMTLVLVGDIEDMNPESLFAEYFGDVEPPLGPVLPEPAVGAPKNTTTVYVIHEDEIPNVNISLEVLRPYVEQPYTSEVIQSRIPLNFAHSMLNLRFSELAKKEETAFLGAGVSRAGGLEVYDGGSLSVSSEPGKWEQSLAQAEYELRRALAFGFQQAELDEVRADALRGLDEAVDREGTRSSRGLLNEILAAAEARSVPTNAETDRNLRKAAIEGLTVEACHQALVDNWADGEHALYATGSIGADVKAADLQAAYDRARSIEVEQGATISVDVFAYAGDGSRGEVVHREHVEDLDLWMVRFDNGVRLNIKATDFKDREIRMTARVAEGMLSLDPADYPLGFVGRYVFNGGGLAAHSEDDLRRLTAGKQVGVGYGMGSDAFSLGGNTTKEDLLFQFELMCAYLENPGWREEGLIQLRQQLPLIYQQMEHLPQGPLLLEFLPALHDGDPRFAQLPPQEQAEAVDVDDVRTWLAPQLANGPIELTIVGDVDVDDVIDKAAQTFGRLPVRRDIRPYSDRRAVGSPVAGLRMNRDIATMIPKSLVFMAFPTDDGMEASRRRHLSFLGAVVSDRLRLEVRERLGAAYSPGAGSQADTTFEGVGMVTIQANSDPDKVDTLVEACLAVADDLAINGITEEEVHRLREPRLSQLRDARRTNGWWLGAISNVQTDTDTLPDLRSIDAFYEGLSAGPLNELAAKYLPRERASVLVVNPAPAGSH